MTEQQKKQIEQEAATESFYHHSSLANMNFKEGYIAAATKYQSLLDERDMEIGELKRDISKAIQALHKANEAHGAVRVMQELIVDRDKEIDRLKGLLNEGAESIVIAMDALSPLLRKLKLHIGADKADELNKKWQQIIKAESINDNPGPSMPKPTCEL